MDGECPKRTVKLPFGFGDIVYHRLGKEQFPGMVTGFHVRVNNMLIAVTWQDMSESTHYFFELTTEFSKDWSE